MSKLTKIECFKCGEPGHWSNACPNDGGSGGSRSGPSRSGSGGGGGGGAVTGGTSAADILIFDNTSCECKADGQQNATSVISQATGPMPVPTKMPLAGPGADPALVVVHVQVAEVEEGPVAVSPTLLSEVSSACRMAKVAR